VSARILIITNGHLCRNPRPLKEAETLGRTGYDVTVLTVRNHAASEAHDCVLLQDALFRRELALDDFAATPTERARAFLSRAVTWAARRLPWPMAVGLGPTMALLGRARHLPADLIIVHTDIGVWAGARLLAGGRRVAADFEDWHSEDLLPNSRRHMPLAQLRDAERTLLHHAAYTTTTSYALATALHARYGGCRPHVITNSFPLQPAPRRAFPAEPPAFFWFSQTLGPGRGLEPFLAAWGHTQQPSRLVLLGEPCAGFDRRLLALLPAERRSRLSFLPLVPPAVLPAVIARHDIGLALEQSDIPSRDLTITNKILQYLNAGLAIVASDTAGQREVLAADPAAGVFLDLRTPTTAAEILDRLLADRAELARHQHAARRLAEVRYSWEHEAPRLRELVAGALLPSAIASAAH
jgi:glycosyltransferase involved in cell wall biosynthesis